MCGGEDKAFAAAKPVLENMGKKIVHCGGAGAGQAAKICNNMILGISMIGVGEAFALAEKLGLSHQALFDVASTSSGQCWALTTYCPVPGPVPASPANNGYKPGFAVGSDAEGPDAVAGRRQRRRRRDAARQACAGASTRPSTPPAMAGWTFPGLSSTFRPRRRNNGARRMTTFKEARAFLLKHRTDYDTAVAGLSLARSGRRSTGRSTGSMRNSPAIPTARDRTALWIVDAGRHGDKAVLRGAVAPLQPGRQLPARAGAEARRSSAAAARQCGAAVGDHAGGDEARRRRDPRDHAARRSDELQRPARPRQRQGWWWRRRIRSRSSQASAATGSGSIVVSATSKHDGWLAVRGRGQRSGHIHAGWPDQRRRSDAALFHLGHHGEAEAGAAQPAQLSGRRAVDDVLARPAARRRASQHFLAGLGQACLELLLRAVECRRHGVRGQPAALRRQGAARDRRPLRRHHAVRAADGVAAVHPGEAGRLQGRAARGLRRRRAAQSGSDRPGQGGLGPHHPRRLRPDRDHRARRQFAGPDRSRSARWAARCRAIEVRVLDRRWQSGEGGRGDVWCSAPIARQA